MHFQTKRDQILLLFGATHNCREVSTAKRIIADGLLMYVLRCFKGTRDLVHYITW